MQEIRKNRPRLTIKPASKLQAIALSDIDVKDGSNKKLFSCKKGDTVTYNETFCKSDGETFLLFNNGVKLSIAAFKLI